MSNINDTMIILKCREPNKQATKEFSTADDGMIYKKSFSAGTFFTYEEVDVSSIYDLYNVLKSLLHEPQKLAIRGKPKKDAKNTVRRKMHGDGAAFDPQARYWLILDIDKVELPKHFDPAADPVAVIAWILTRFPPCFKSATCVYKFSSSQNVPAKIGEKPKAQASVHLAFFCDRAVTEAEWKRFFKENHAPVDQALFSAVQIHYTAAPIFNNMDDPMPERIGIIEGASDTVSVPEIPEAQVKKPAERPDKPPKINQDNQDKAIELLLPYYEESSRNRLSGAITGALYRGGWEAENAADFVFQLAEKDGDEEAMSRYDCALRICEAIDNDQPAQGIPTLRDEFDIECLDEILTLLGIGEPDIEGRISKLNKSSTVAEIEEVMKLLLSAPASTHDIYLEQIKKETDQAKGAVNGMFRAIKKEVRNRLSADQAVCLMEMFLADHYEAGRLLLRIKDGNYWRYNGRHWEIEPEDAIKKLMLPIANQLYNPEISLMGVSPMVNAALNLLKGRVFGRGDPLRQNATPPMVINARNGEAWLTDKGHVSFQPHKPESYLRNCLSIDYDPAAKSPRFDNAVLEICKGSSEPEEMFRHIMEIIGYICQPWRKIPAILLFYGKGSNGKTSITGVLERLLGDGNYMADRINDIEKHIFKIGALDGKLMLIDDDVEMGVCLPDGFLKKTSEEKTMTGQHKNGPSFEFKCRAVPVMLSNHYPSIKDLSYGLRRRLMVVPFLRQFKEEEIIPGLFDDIWDEEASGILNHAIAGFQRLKERKRFDEPKDCIEAKDVWVVRSNELVTFIDESCRIGSDEKQPFTHFYNNFKDYCYDAGVKNVPARKGIKDRLESMGYDITSLDGYPTVRGLYAPAPGEIQKEVESLTADEIDELIEEDRKAAEGGDKH